MDAVKVQLVSGGVVHSICGSTEGLIRALGRRRWLTRTVRGDRLAALRELNALAAHANIAPTVGAHTTVAEILDQWTNSPSQDGAQRLRLSEAQQSEDRLS